MKTYFYIFISILLIALGFTPAASLVRNSFVSAIGPFSYAFYFASNKINHEINFWINIRNLSKKNLELESKVWQLESILAEKKDLVSENEILKEQLNLNKEEFKPSLVLANVYGYSVYNDKEGPFVYLDKGSNNKISAGDPVILSSVLLGEIQGVERNFSKVMLASDPNFVASVFVERSKISAIVKGSFGTKLVMERILQNDDVAEGDLVLTSGVDGRFPKNLVVGTVETINSAKEGIEKEAVIASPIEINKINKVFIIL